MVENPKLNYIIVLKKFFNSFLFVKTRSMQNIKIAFSGFFNLYTCTNGKVLKFQFKSKFFALLLKLFL